MNKTKVIWLTGLSGAGKTTLSDGINLQLIENGYITKVLDGDAIRFGLCKDLFYSQKDRMENIRRIAEVTKLLLECKVTCINSFITPTNDIREMVYDILGRDRIIEIFVNTSLHTCIERDPKGLYEKVKKGVLTNFTGIDLPFEAPSKPDLEIRTEELDIQQSIQKCIDFILPHLLDGTNSRY